MSYQPDPQVLERYGRVLVDFALGNGTGIKPGDTVLITGAEETKPLFAEACRAVWRSGGNVIQLLATTKDAQLNLERDFYALAGEAQLDFFAEKVMRGLIDQCDHLLHIGGEDDPRAMADVDPGKMMRHQSAQMPMVAWQQEKEAAGLLHWTIGLWGTAGMAAEAGLSLEQYWQQIIRACFLDDSDPIARWREAQADIARYREWLNALPIERLHVEAEGTDLWLTIGQRRRWVSGSGRNIPSFEIFTSPDWRGTTGHISFSEPLYSHGKIARGIRLEFKDGLVSSATAEENGELIEQIVSAPGGNRVGEFSLTDARLSRIEHFMANTLYDENMGGPFGNTHLAVGMSLQDTYDGDAAKVGEEEWQELGYNLAAAVHNDIVSTTDRTVTAVMRDGSQRVIYAGGRFQLEQ
jgi:aminopeptidase